MGNEITTEVLFKVIDEKKRQFRPMNKRITIIVGIIAIVFIGFGGKLYMDKKAEETATEEQRNLLETERESAVALKNKYRDIKSIKFDKSSGPDRQTMTGAYHMRVTIMNQKNNLSQLTLLIGKNLMI